jgi:hypothetical protein
MHGRCPALLAATRSGKREITARAQNRFPSAEISDKFRAIFNT